MSAEEELGGFREGVHTPGKLGEGENDVQLSVAPFAAMKRMQDVREQMGDVRDLEEVLVGMRLAGTPDLRYVSHRYQGIFGLYDVPQRWAYDYSCATRYGNENIAAQLQSNRYGRFFVAVLRSRADSSA